MLKGQLVTCVIVGARFRPPAAGLLSVLGNGSPLRVRREPSNAYDPNALQVLVNRSTLEGLPPAQLEAAVQGFGFSVSDVLDVQCWHLGYIPRREAEELAPAFDAAGTEETPASLTFDLAGKPAVAFVVP